MITHCCLTANGKELRGLIVQNVKMVKNKEYIGIQFEVNFSKLKLDRHYRLRVHPELYKNSEYITLSKFSLTGSAKHIMEQRDSLFKRSVFSEFDVSSNYILGKSKRFVYAYSVKYETWMDTLSIRFGSVLEDCCSTKKVDDIVVVKDYVVNTDSVVSFANKPYVISNTFSKIKIDFSEFVKGARPIKKIVDCDMLINSASDYELRLNKIDAKTNSDTVVVEFESGIATFKESFKSNKSLIIKLTNNNDNLDLKQLEKLNIIGFSVSDDLNISDLFISRKRIEVIREFLVKKLGINSSCVDMTNNGFEWTILNKLVTVSNLPIKDSLSNIIKSDLPSVKKKYLLYNIDGGNSYKQIFDMYNSLYTDKVFVVLTYKYRYDNIENQINKSIDLINNRNIDNAINMLHQIDFDKRSYNALGVAYQLKGDLQNAIYYFRKAVENDNEDAKINLRLLQRVIN